MSKITSKLETAKEKYQDFKTTTWYGTNYVWKETGSGVYLMRRREYVKLIKANKREVSQLPRPY